MKLASRVVARYLSGGLIEVPPKLYDAISDWLEALCEAQDKAKTPKKSAAKKFEVTENLLHGWRYGESFARRFPEQWKRALGIELTIKVAFKKSAGSLGGRSSGVHLIELNTSITGDLEKMRQTLVHELTHWVQHFMQNILDEVGGGKAGLPSRHMLDEVKQRGGDFRSHRLDDREFYSILRDEVTKLNRAFEHIRNQARKYELEGDEDYEDMPEARDYVRDNLPDLIRHYTRASSKRISIPRALTTTFSTLGQGLFDHLAKDSPEKWKKAVGILIDKLEPWTHPQAWK